MKIYVIVKNPKCDYDEYADYEEYDEQYKVYDDFGSFKKPNSERLALPNEKAANVVMNAKGFDRYVARHGYHFTNELARVASDMMVNSNGYPHKWTPEQVESMLKVHGYTRYDKCTLGDITYLANMAYADFYPKVIKDEQSCIKYAIQVANDPDGYDGLVFSRWIADLIGKKSKAIDWERFI